MIRLAGIEDCELVSSLLRAFFSHEGRTVARLTDNVYSILSDPGRGFFTLADEAGVASTTIRISTGGGASAQIEEIWVQPSARGRGLGAKLVRASVHECLRRGIASIELRVSADDQELGIPDFYAKQGFRHGGRIIFEYVGDAA
jgi:GNAT superfamily N-acetyltransferase